MHDSNSLIMQHAAYINSRLINAINMHVTRVPRTEKLAVPVVMLMGSSENNAVYTTEIADCISFAHIKLLRLKPYFEIMP